MKITGSKFRDFYEYDCYKYGKPSELPEWNRNTYLVEDRDKEDDRSIIVHYGSDLDNIIRSSFLYDITPKYNWRGKYQYNKANLTSIVIEEQIVGIYPYLYYIPQVGIREKTGDSIFVCGQRVDETVFKPFNVDDAIALLKEPEYYKEILVYYGLDYQQCLYPEQIIKAGQNIQSKWRKREYRNINDPFVVECREIFHKFGEPIIRFFPKNVERYPHHSRETYKFFADLNINLLSTPLLKWYSEIQTERDIYTEIENWVINQQREPEHIPDNKTKIVSHGFDLKTSFRKM